MQRTIQRDIVDLVTGALEESVEAVAVGLFEASDLVGVAAYAAVEHFEVLCLATEVSSHGKGIGAELKRRLLAVAGESGHTQVFSLVHRANEPMLAINRALGAWVERDESDTNFMLCIVNV